ncbi:unnamed protein product, partial [Lymnaea stagnalis]
ALYWVNQLSNCSEITLSIFFGLHPIQQSVKMKEENGIASLKRGDTPMEHIPLSDTLIAHISLGDTPMEHIPLSDTPMEHIPLGDTPMEHIPLGDTPYLV